MFGKGKTESISQSRLDATRRRHGRGARAPANAAPANAAPAATAPVPLPTASAPSPTADAAERERGSAGVEDIYHRLCPLVLERIDPATAPTIPRKDIADQVTALVGDFLSHENLVVQPLEQRGLVTALTNEIMAEAQRRSQGESGGVLGAMSEDGAMTLAPMAAPRAGGSGPRAAASRSSVDGAASRVQGVLMDRIDVAAASELPRHEIAQQITEIVGEILTEQKIQLNQLEQRDLVTLLLNDMLGLGPLEPLLADDTITDIMVNGPKQVYVERAGKLVLTDIEFRDNQHVMNVATRIVTGVGRRIDESSPLVDARLEDGSRVNIIVPPLAIDGPTISIRKFAKKGITLDLMMRQKNLSPEMATVLKIAARSQLNILISGGTGSGKTTLLNALSQMIDIGERIVTIEDAAELQLQQPHVVRLETRPSNLEGDGEVTMRDLVKNALRMRPDRIILGEVRGSEAVDMLQAMNTGHEGSLGTIHANRPREALTRLENMIGLAGINLPAKAVRTQIAAALDLIVQVSRMRDGVRRVTSIMEVVGMEGDVITTQELFAFEFEGEGPDGILQGTYKSSGLRPAFAPKAEYFGLHRMLLEAM